LVMLLVFFITLGRDVYRWFTIMPGLVQQRNDQLEKQAAAVRDLKSSAESKLQEINRDEELELKNAANDAEKEQIRKDYDTKFRPRALADQEAYAREQANAEKGIRPNTSPAALLFFFFTHGPSSEKEAVGILPALLGSLYIVLITLATAVP